MTVNSQFAKIALEIETLTRSARIALVRSGHGGSSPRVFSPDRQADLTADDEVVARIFDPDELLDVDRLPSMPQLERIAAQLVDLAWDAHEGRGREPGPPLSILLHGPLAPAMAYVVHLLGIGFDADLVHMFASAILPNSNGGSQPIVAPVVNKTRDLNRGVLFIDQLDELAVADRGDIRRQRAMADLVAEVLRPVYGRAPVVIAAFRGSAVPPRGLTDRFDHIVPVDVPETDDAEVATVPTGPVDHADHGVRTAPVHQRAQRSAPHRPSFMGSAA